MELFAATLIGLLTGACAGSLFPTRNPGSVLLSVILGLLGSIAAYVWAHGVGRYDEATAFIASVLGAISFIAMHRIVIPDIGQL